MIIKGVNFPDPLLNALRDGRLVIFAGAGVSMGAPANMPDFSGLAQQIAVGTGQAIGEGEEEDRFLGRLKDAGTDVHRRAADVLQMNNPEPTDLHRSLLRLFTIPEDVRIVTTNFDLLLDQAAQELFETTTSVFMAPALPYGGRFKGVVHIHGSVSQPEEMVLTSQDFGRAYLTESDGWARRFLVDLFTEHTLLFVGYSHNDTIMTYLTPSLPKGEDDRRYALIGGLSDEQERWRNLGIEPIPFPQVGGDYTGLDRAISSLADYRRRGTLGWRQEITKIASGPPPLEEESSGIIEHALTNPVYTRFFTDAAKSPEWIDWLDTRGYLDALFSYGDLTEGEKWLAGWLPSRFAIEKPDVLFSVIGRHGSRLNVDLWNMIAQRMLVNVEPLADAKTLSRWIHLLISATPPNFNDVLLGKIAENCANQGLLVNVLQIYDTMTAICRHPDRRFARRNADLSTYQIRTLWEQCLKPNLPEIAESLIDKTVWRLEERHSLIMAWEGERLLDSDTFRRSAIEPHAQDRHPRGIDALIDIARDCLEWLVANQPDAAKLRSERYSRSKSALLRRLAVHILPSRNDLSADEKIAWLLEHYDLNELPAKHEIYRVVASVYPEASLEQRERVIESVLSYQWPGEDHPDKESLTAFHKFEWLKWLNDAAPDCLLAKHALETILVQYPDFSQSEHPDMIFWTDTWARVRSPWTVDELLEKPAREWLAELVEYQSTRPSDPVNRAGLLTAIGEAAQKNVEWGLELASEMASAGLWDVDLWPFLIRAWGAAELDQDCVRQVLERLSDDNLYQYHVHELTNALCEVVKKVTGPETSELIDRANTIAGNLHDYAIKVEPSQMTRYVGGVEEEVDWYTKALNSPSGRLAQFWLQSIALWRKQQEQPPTTLGDDHQDVLAKMMANQELPGKLARVILVSNIPFLTFVDEDWSKLNLIPLLDHSHEEFESAWNSITYSSNFTARAAELLKEPFLQAVEHINDRMTTQTRCGFITRYTWMLTSFVTCPTDQWITKLLASSGQEVRRQFSTEIGHFLRHLDEPIQKEWWNAWLRGYWENRLDGIPAPLDAEETETMTEWTFSLTAVYPEAVELAIKMPVQPLQRLMLGHQLADSAIPGKHPEALAKLLIHLGEADDLHYMWHGSKPVIDQLLQTPLDAKTKTGLEEIIAKFHL